MRRSLLVIAAALAMPAPAGAQELADGHVDYAARLVDGRLRSLVKDGTRGGEPVWREPGSVVFALGPAARVAIPSGVRTAFLGRPGDPIWTIPQVQRSGVLWAGWNTEELSSARIDGPLTWTLTAVEGPGEVAVFQTGAFGDVDILFRSNDGLPDSRTVPLGTHAHGSWSFSRVGDYRLTFAMSGRATSGDLLTDRQVLPVSVRSEPTATPAPTVTPTPDAGAPAMPDGPAGAAPRTTTLTLGASAPRLRVRTLSLALRLSTRSRVTIVLRRGGRTSARAKTRTVPAGSRTDKVLLDRRPTAGLHSVRITATADEHSVTRTVRLRVRKR